MRIAAVGFSFGAIGSFLRTRGSSRVRLIEKPHGFVDSIWLATCNSQLQNAVAVALRLLRGFSNFK